MFDALDAGIVYRFCRWTRHRSMHHAVTVLTNHYPPSLRPPRDAQAEREDQTSRHGEGPDSGSAARGRRLVARRRVAAGVARQPRSGDSGWA